MLRRIHHHPTITTAIKITSSCSSSHSHSLSSLSCCSYSPLLAPTLLFSSNSIHERLPRVREYLTDEKMDAAKSALIQLNLMVSQGIEPDVHMYTSLILIMGRAKLEWQAFKLFSRMLEQGLKPLPETYLALKRATNPKRQSMIDKIEAKMVEMNDLLPEQIANSVVDQRDKSNRSADRQMRELKNPTKIEQFDSEKDFGLPASASGGDHNDNNNVTNDEHAKETIIGNEEDNLEDHYRSSNSVNQIKKNQDRQLHKEKIAELWKQGQGVPTMKIDSLESVIATIGSIDARRAHQDSLATGKQRTKLRDELLNKMHEEELRIILSIHRQARNGTKDQLINRILAEVPADYLEATLDRRFHYFDSVKKVLELQIDELKSIQDQEERKKKQQQQQQSQSQQQEEQNDEEEDEMMRDLLQSIDIRSTMKQQVAVVAKEGNDGGVGGSSSLLDLSNKNNNNNPNATSFSSSSPIQPKDASQLTPQEKYNMSPSHLETPWGLIRRPIRPPPNPSAPNEERDERQRLTEQELTELRNSLINGSLDQIPQRTLRRYCRHFHLKWSRKSGAAALQDMVEWHLRTFKPKIEDVTSGSGDLIDQRHQQQRDDEKVQELESYDAAEEERRAQQQTLDQYNALLAVARVTDNMKLVDDAHISKTVYDRQQLDRLEKKRTMQSIESDKWKARLANLNENMRKMPPGFKQRSEAVKEDDPRTQDLLTKTGEEASSRILGIEDITRDQQNLLNEQLIASSLEQEERSHQQRQRTSITDDIDANEMNQANSYSKGKPTSNNNNNNNVNKNYPNSRNFNSNSSTVMTATATSSSSSRTAQELPPWETSASSSVSSSHAPFNLRTGRFDVGVPDAEFYEDSTGRYKVRRPMALRQRFHVDESLLPAPQQERIRQERFSHEQEQQGDEQDRDLRRGKYSKTAQRLKAFQQKARDRKKMEKSEVQPLPAPQRMSQRLRWNNSKSATEVFRGLSNTKRRGGDESEKGEI